MQAGDYLARAGMSIRFMPGIAFIFLFSCHAAQKDEPEQAHATIKVTREPVTTATTAAQQHPRRLRPMPIQFVLDAVRVHSAPSLWTQSSHLLGGVSGTITRRCLCGSVAALF